MNIEFTNAERVLYNATYEFAVNIEKLNPEQAREKAMNKVISKRAMASKIRFKY